MIAFLAKRLLWMVGVLWMVYTITFILMRSVPGGPFESDRNSPPAVRRNLERRFKVDDPLPKQYIDGLWGVATLNIGASMRLYDFSVNEIIAQGLPISATLGILAMTFAVVLGVSAGMVSALRRNTWLDVAFMTAATVGIAVPNFVLASMAIVLFVFVWHVAPAAGWGTPQQLILPALCLGAPFAAYIARLTRTGLLETLGQDYIRTAYAKGLSPRRVIVRHALRGAMLPVVSYLGPATAGILTGSLVLEKIFALPGMGSHFIEAATQRDYTLAMGVVLVYTALLFVMNTLVDISYAYIDPRVKLE